MRRRQFIGLLGRAAAAVPASAWAQSGRPRPLIAWLGGSSPNNPAAVQHLSALLQGLREHGYEDGKNLDIVYRWANDDNSRQSTLAKELISINPAVIVTANNESSIAVRQVTTTIPIVGALIVEPLKLGLAKSFNRPEYNLTGVLATVDTLPAKKLELLLELVPAAKNDAVLINPTNPTQQEMVQHIEASVRERKLTVVRIDAQDLSEVDAGLEKLARSRPDALIFGSDILFFSAASRILTFADETRTPTVFAFAQHVQRGGLVSYGIVSSENFRRAAYFVDRILKGARPGDLPIELPVKFHLTINLKTASKLGLTVPPRLLFTADEVIE